MAGMNVMEIAAVFAGVDPETVSLFGQFIAAAKAAPDRNLYLKTALRRAMTPDVKVVEVTSSPRR